MNSERLERYRPRALSGLGRWDISPLRLKVYGLCAEGQALSDSLLEEARDFTRSEVPPRVEAEGQDNGLGFVIVHPGDLGVSISAHWWIQGSVLCQHIRRRLWGAKAPLDTVRRPVVACVWELAVIDAEQRAWRETMMTARPDPEAYLRRRVAAEDV
ncbi:hypothetical protein [Algihabitans albus]|uniref:hypothetical protein n=1 Tax=Algihabitans albus TaxID=2164067 RepID=UPI000E5CE383|nr:hypothetical protein [Algihabitans albus]